VNQNQIANSLGVSRSTVSYVLAGKAKEKRISSDVVEKVRLAAETVNYKPNSSARSLSRQRTKQIGILLRNAADRPFDNPAAMEYLVGINLRLETVGYVPVFVRVGDLASERGLPSRVFSEHMVDGIIAIGAFSAPLVERLKDLSDSCIWLDSTVYEPERCLRRDEEEAGRLVAQMAIDAGYRELVWYSKVVPTSPTHVVHYSAVDRERGIYQAAAAAGIPVHNVVLARNFDRQAQADMIPLLRPDVAWLTGGSFDASRLSHAAGALGLRVGLDFGIACCDEWEDTRMTWPELSRVTFSRLDMGIAAADMLMAVLHHPQAPCPSATMRFPPHRGATLLGPAAGQVGAAESSRQLLKRIADPQVSPPWSDALNSVAHKVGRPANRDAGS